ncbi:hypothetical protein Droror1_Dr00022199 [Drosera rotundifolia]
MHSIMYYHSIWIVASLLITINNAAVAVRSLGSNPAVCGRSSLPALHTLRSDQITVLINGYAESRIPLLHSVAAAYAASSLVSSVLILWSNPSTSPLTLSQLSHNLSLLYSASGAAIEVINQRSRSLNNRFLPRRGITTRGVLICDDDIEVDLASFEFAVRVWGSNEEKLIGLFVRSHDLDLGIKSWIYTVHHDKYSIVLTKFMVLKTEYLYEYSCGGGETMRRMRDVVDRLTNCEDILMNFVVADKGNVGPVMVVAENVRDWGDPRNEGEAAVAVQGEGLSGVRRGRGEHRKRRGECITEFHRILGRMPLRYSYGKVVDGVGEQGLCEKAGKLVLCDDQMLR